MGPETQSMAMNAMPTAQNRQQDRHMNRKGIPHKYYPSTPLELGIKKFKSVVRNTPVGNKARTQLIKRYKERAWADLKKIMDAAPTKEQVVLSGQQ